MTTIHDNVDCKFCEKPFIMEDAGDVFPTALARHILSDHLDQLEENVAQRLRGLVAVAAQQERIESVQAIVEKIIND